MKENELLYDNGYGGFSLDGKEYIIYTQEKTTPLPWSHIISNEKFGTIITTNGGGYVWYGNSQSNKLTAWSNDCLRDMPSEKLILRIGNKRINILPYDSLTNYTVIYGFGYAKFIYEDNNLYIETLIYVPLQKNKKVYNIKVIKKCDVNNFEEECSVDYDINAVLGVSKEFTKKHIVFEKKNDYIKIKNKYREEYSNDDVFIKANEGINIVSTDNTILKTNIPVTLKRELDMVYGNIKIEIGCEEENLQQNLEEDLKQIDIYWNEKMKKVKVYTPVESMNIMMNGWLYYQTLCCRMWARTSFYQAGGAFGFRDQLQDSLMMLWFDPSITKKQISYHAMHQFEEGDVLHWWHPEKNNGTRTRYSDDLLWLPYVLSKYIEFTGDTQFLNEKVSYVTSQPLGENEEERYTSVEMTEYEDTIFNHAKRAIQYGVKLSENGLPKMNGGDWNDGMNKVRGQSIWLGFFIYSVLNNFKNLCEIQKDIEMKNECERYLKILKESLNEYGWDGKWFRRAYFESGEPVGSSQNDECKIDGISQSWAVISGAGDKDKCMQAMDSLDSYLVDRENMIIKLLTPPFEKMELNPGYIKEYIPGVRENGGQYTHGASCCGQFWKANGDGPFWQFLN